MPGAPSRLFSSLAPRMAPKTFLFRSRLPRKDVQSPFADLMRTRHDLLTDVVITVKDFEKDNASDFSKQSGSLTKSATSKKSWLLSVLKTK
uniref:Uncharacterized protein n=1 Tax=Setaria digitata TaxID=48799 RepID=A0A915Q3E1_9BILA